MAGNVKPGTIILDTSEELHYPALWGVVLPSEVFVKYFVKSRGETSWPTGFEVTHEGFSDFCHKWGYYLPTDSNLPINKKDLSCRILSPEDFAKSEGVVGVLYLGEVFEPRDRKEINFEVKRVNYFRSFEPRDLRAINATREAAFLEAGSRSRVVPYDAGHHLELMEKFYYGRFVGKSLDEVESQFNPHTKGFVGLLRECGFDERLLSD